MRRFPVRTVNCKNGNRRPEVLHAESAAQARSQAEACFPYLIEVLAVVEQAV